MSAADARTRLLSPGTIRGAALLLCATSIVGMIVTSIADRIDAAIAFGFVGAVGTLTLLLVGVLVPVVEAASALENGVQRLVDAGADADDLRSTVRAAIQLGRRSAGD
jgi:hypothetical protein